MIGCTQQAPVHQIVFLEGDSIRISQALVNDGEVHFFTYQSEGKNINFVRPDVTGRLQTHFDACYSCFKYKPGYVREGNQVICITCRIGYDLDSVIWDYVGACAPISLKSQISSGRLVIRRFWLQKGENLF